MAQRLQTGFEADLARRASLILSRFPHQQPSGVIDDPMHTDFVAYAGRRLASQDVHTHRRFEVTQEQLDIPTSVVECDQILGAVGGGIGQGCDQDEASGAKARGRDVDSDLTQRQRRGHGFPLFAGITRPRIPSRFGPFDEKIVIAQYGFGMRTLDGRPEGQCENAIDVSLLQSPDIVIAAKTLVAQQDIARFKVIR